MIYLDSNILIYAFSQNVDTEHQQQKSINIFEKLITENKLIISEITLLEFAFVSKKIKELPINIEHNINFLNRYVQQSNSQIIQRTIKIMHETKMYNNSFDCFHLAFSEYFCNKIVTFDKGFQKFSKISEIKIDIF